MACGQTRLGAQAITPTVWCPFSALSLAILITSPGPTVFSSLDFPVLGSEHLSFPPETQAQASYQVFESTTKWLWHYGWVSKYVEDKG